MLAYLQAQGEARVAELVEALGLHPATVRRALARLANRGLAERGRGGARLFEAVRYVGDMRHNLGISLEAKRRIAKKAASLVEPGMRVGISGGSTCTHLARLLRGSPVEVVTNAVNVAVELYSYPKTRVHVLGGELNAYSYELVGPRAIEAAAKVELDLLFVGATGINEKGFFMRDQPEASVARALKERAKAVYVLADSSKWGKQAFGFFAALDEVSGWIRED